MRIKTFLRAYRTIFHMHNAWSDPVRARNDAVIIPHQQLSAEALAGVIEEYVTRDGTEWSEASTKAAAVHRGLDLGTLVLVYDPDAESCNIVPADQLAG